MRCVPKTRGKGDDNSNRKLFSVESRPASRNYVLAGNVASYENDDIAFRACSRVGVECGACRSHRVVHDRGWWCMIVSCPCKHASKQWRTTTCLACVGTNAKTQPKGDDKSNEPVYSARWKDKFRRIFVEGHNDRQRMLRFRPRFPR